MGLVMSKGHNSIPIYSGYPTNIVGLILKGHGHMAVVIKSNEDAKTPANSSISNPSMLTINTHASSCSMPVDHRDYFSARTANYKRREQGDGNVLHENVESHPGNSDEEIIGIITMKDVMEELLQEDIWDENGGYIVIHNR
ncbi:duf21 domain-containing protein [Quercus suber]|uniref:Duf21 domain-containing protein n=1 Tax=Quercus suber TaxID=58331 RepID=A0AAW0KDC4_QUESU